MFLNLKHTCLEVSSNPKDPDYLLQVFLIRLELMMCAFNETDLYQTKQTLQINTKHILHRHVIFIGIWWFVDGISKIVF